MSIFSSYKKIFLLGFTITILIAIPFSVYIAQKRQQTTTKAAASTQLSFEPVAKTVKEGEIFTLSIMLNPGTGNSANQVSFVKLSISYDASKFATLAGSLTANPEPSNALKYIIDDAQYDSGKATISLSIGSDPTYAIKTKTKIAIFQLRAIAATTPENPNITFDPAPNTQVLSIASTDQTNENVLSTTIPAKIVVTAATTTPELPLTPIITSIPSVSGSITPTLPPTSAPVCLNLDVNATEGAVLSPFTFTATGKDSDDGTITKISFNFGDLVEDLQVEDNPKTESEEETASVSGQITHAYTVPGIYTAYAIFTDNENNLSDQQDSCTKTITISSIEPSEAPPLIQPPIEEPGNENIMIGLGVLGIVITIIGGVLLLL